MEEFEEKLPEEPGEDVENNDNEESPGEEIKEEDDDSILYSTKKLLGIPEEENCFDLDILSHINSAVFTLNQLGIGPRDGFFVTSKEQTFSEYIGKDLKHIIPQVKTYFYYKTKLGFDSSLSGTVTEVLKEMIREAEWRLNTEIEYAKKPEKSRDPDRINDIYERLISKV